MTRFLRFAKVSLVVLPLVLVLGCSGYRPRVKRTRTLTAEYVPGIGLSIRTENGNVVIEKDESRGDIEIQAEVTTVGRTTEEAVARQDLVTIATTHRDDNVLEIQVNFGPDRHSGDMCSLRIRTPGANGITVRSFNGTIAFAGFEGASDVETTNGRITVKDHDGSIDARASNGVITLKNVTGPIDATMTNGRIQIDDAGDEVVARTTNGTINYSAADGAQAGFHLRTTNGSISAVLPPSVGGRIEAKTTRGAIHLSAVPPEVSVEGSRRNKTIILSDGDPDSTITTVNGSVTIRWK